MDWLTDIYKLFLDKSYKITHKIFLFMLTAILLLFIDNHLGISTHLYRNNKVEDIERIEKILESKTLTPELRQQLISLEQEIITEKNLTNRVLTYFTSLDSFNVISKKIVKNDAPTSSNYSLYYHIISSTGWVILSVLVLTIILVKSVLIDKKEDIITATEYISALVLLFFYGTGLAIALYIAIPRYNNVSANYLINFLISTCLHLIVFALSFIQYSRILGKKNTKLLAESARLRQETHKFKLKIIELNSKINKLKNS